MTLGRSAWVPNQYTTELGSTGSGAESQFRPPSLLRRIAPVSAILGLLMQLIWFDSATIAHPVIGIAFTLWLAAIGVMLFTGRVERHFRPLRRH